MNAVETPTALARGARPSEPCHLVLLSRITAGKGLAELLDALGSEQLRSRQWRATLAGAGEVEHYRREAALRGLAERVEFPGWLDRPAVSALLLSADVLVLPSLATYGEAMPIAVLEAMAHRVTVVSTAVGAIPEIIADGQSGVIVAPGDPTAFAAAIARLIDDVALRQRLAANGYAFFMENLEISRATLRLADLYADVLAQM